MKTRKGATLVGSLVAITILTTSFIAMLDLQLNIMRAKFFLQHDNTANLLVSEGLEIVRTIYANGTVLPTGINTYQVDTTTASLTSTSTCTDDNVNDIINGSTCDLDEPTAGSIYKMSADTSNKIFYRFVEVDNSTTIGGIPKVTSTVVVRNPRGEALRVYKATIELYRID